MPTLIAETAETSADFLPGLVMSAVGTGATPPADRDWFDRGFLTRYSDCLSRSAAVVLFSAEPSFENAEALTMAKFWAVHEAAPEGARMVLMVSGGKDSSAMLHYYVESVEARVAAGLRFVPATVIAADVLHEFSDMAMRQKLELAAIAKWGAKYGIATELVTPAFKDTVLVELLGNGFALPPKATNDTVARANISNWCVDRVKRQVLDKAAMKAADCAPIVIQVIGSRYDESSSRAYRMGKYEDGLPAGLTRVALTLDSKKGEVKKVIGLHAIGHFTADHIRDFVHERITTYRGLEGNLELERIYREASSDGEEAGECTIRRTKDGELTGGCSNLFSGVRLGCMICLKATNKALRNKAAADPKRFARTYRVQEEINRHQAMASARPRAVLASGFTQDTMFPKGFNFITRYRWLVMILAAELESGERQLGDEQLAWIERRWRRHGVFTVTIEDAKRDAAMWLKMGGDEPPVFFRSLVSHASEFTESLGEGLPLGAFGAMSDPDQADLNLVHLVGLGITGAPVFPEVRAYIFDDFATPLDRFVMVTDTPSVIGTGTNTGLLNGCVGATLRCVGVRAATPWELAMADGRHLFYRYARWNMKQAIEASELSRRLMEDASEPHWSLDDFPTGRIPAKTDSEAYLRFERLKRTVRLGALMTAVSNQNPTSCGVDFEPVTESFYQHAELADLRGKLNVSQFQEGFRLVSHLTALSEYLQENTSSQHHAMLERLKREIGDRYELLTSDSDEGKKLRSGLRIQLRKAIFHDESIQAYEEYICALKSFGRALRDGTMNTALALRMAYITRTAAICESDAVDLAKTLEQQLALVRPSSANATYKGENVPEPRGLVTEAFA